VRRIRQELRWRSREHRARPVKYKLSNRIAERQLRLTEDDEQNDEQA
jgi:hypothetical protein